MAEFLAPLNSAEEDSETSWYKSFGAGLVSGLIKIPEGVVSLGAELVDLGADSNTAADVEQFFDKMNPFEEIAEENTIGKLTEAIMQIAVPGGIGFKVASKAARKMATKALKAKRNKAYADFGKGNKFWWFTLCACPNMDKKDIIKQSTMYLLALIATIVIVIGMQNHSWNKQWNMVNNGCIEYGLHNY